MLFKSAEDLKQHLAGNQRNLSDATIMPFVAQAEIRHIIPAVGQAFYDTLEAAYRAATPAAPLSATLLAALVRIQRALAYYTLLEALPFLNVAVGNLGIQEPSTEKSAPARQWSYVELQAAAAENADTFLDNALAFLEAKADDYPTWKSSPEYTRSRALFLNNAAQLAAFLNTGGSRRVYLALRPFIARAEDLHILPALGSALFDEMKAHTLAPAPLAPAYRVILQGKIQKALAQHTLHLAVVEVGFVFTPAGLKLQSRQGAAGNLNTPALADIEAVRQNARLLADRYLADLRQYLDANADTIPAYLASDTYRAQTRRRHQLPDNAGRASFRV